MASLRSMACSGSHSTMLAGAASSPAQCTSATRCSSGSAAISVSFTSLATERLYSCVSSAGVAALNGG